MTRADRADNVFGRFLPTILCISAAICGSCAKPVESEPPTLFYGHKIGEGSQAWAAEEPSQDIDPLSKCQQMIRSPLLDQSLEPERRCREFVEHGLYQIDLRDSNGSNEKLFRFTNWKLSLIVVRYGNAERDHVSADLDAHFKNMVPGKLWTGSTGNYIEIRPLQELETFTGRAIDKADGFLVIVSAGA